MLNQIVLVGRIKNMLNDTIYLDVQRSTKNDNGEYEHDIVPVKLSGTLLEKTLEYCNVGDVVGAKGRIQSEVNDIAEDTRISIVAEKITFLSSRKVD